MSGINDEDLMLLRRLASGGGSFTEPHPGHSLNYARVVKAGYVFALTGNSEIRYQLTRAGWAMIDVSHD